MPTLVVDPAQYAHAAASMTSVAHSAHSAVSTLAVELGASSGMAGSDNAGTAWADGYDQGARAALGAAASAVGAVGNIATRLHATGENHAHADASSVIGGGGDGSVGAAPTPPTMSAPSVPSSAGGSGGGPPGWSLVESLVGYVWPNGHQDRLHAADAAWKAAAAQLQDAAGPTSAAASAVSAQQSPESAAAAQACTDTGSHLRELSSVFTELGSSCSEYAAHLDQAHHEIIHELEVLLAQTVAIEAVSAIAGFFTAGIGELAGQAVETARLTAAANRIRGIIEGLIAAARVVASKVGEVAAKAVRVSVDAAKAAQSPVTRAATAVAKAAPKNFAVGSGLEAAKEGVLTVETGHNHFDPTRIAAQGASSVVTSPAAQKIASSGRLGAKIADIPGGQFAARTAVNSQLSNLQQHAQAAISPELSDKTESTGWTDVAKALPGSLPPTQHYSPDTAGHSPAQDVPQTGAASPPASDAPDKPSSAGGG